MSLPLPWAETTPCVHGVHLLGAPSAFEERYAAVRGKETRMLNDAQLRRLPDGTGLWNASEWAVRKRGARRLLAALARRPDASPVLEVGCGNGWLSGMLHRAGHAVVGIDPFTMELEQAARVFPGPLFVRADFSSAPLREGHFGTVVFAASIQWLPDAQAAMHRSLALTAPGGEVHVLDSVLHPDAATAKAASERSRAYYAALGFPEMAQHYHAHRINSLQGLGTSKLLSAPARWKRLLGNRSPFTHLVIAK
jgi:SAM-dependent methyltransferase